jgi:hypothetical protein
MTLKASLPMICTFLFACGGGGGDSGTVVPSSDDPRCSALCTIDIPRVDGAFGVCDTDSASNCVDLCEARIKGASSICGSCLLEQAEFQAGYGGGSSCTNDQCTISSELGSCTFTDQNQAQEEDCDRKVFPRKTVSCTVEFESVTKCASVCQ